MVYDNAMANGAVAPAFDRRVIVEWAARHRVDPSLVDIDEEGYPCCERVPMPQGDEQNDQLVYLEPALRDRYAHRADVYVANDRLVNGASVPVVSAAPDLMVAFGAAPHRRAGGRARRSYNLAVPGNPPPAFVLETLSERTKDNDLRGKPEHYAAMGVREYWLFDPRRRDIADGLAAYVLRAGVYVPIAPQAGGSGFRSKVLGVDFRVVADGDLRMRDVATGEDLQSYSEQRQAKEQATVALAREHRAKQAAEAELERKTQLIEKMRQRATDEFPQRAESLKESAAEVESR